MPWFYVDDAFTHSKPVMAMPDRYRLAACGLWVLGGAWSAREKMDGRINRSMLRQLLSGTRQPLPDILKATDGTYEPLWVDGPDGEAQTHLWSKWQPTAAQLRAERDANARKMREWRERNPKRKPGRNVRGRLAVTGEDSEMLPVTQEVTDDGQLTCVTPYECGPDPEPEPISTQTTPDGVVSHPTPNGDGREPARKRATRLPDGWIPDKAVIDAMRKKFPQIDLREEHDRFSDHWRAKSGRDATKLDWNATWRNWIREAARRMSNGHRPGSQENGHRPSKVRVAAELAAQMRAEENNQPHQEELEP